MRTNIQPLFDEFKLHATDDYVFRGFSGRIRQLVIQGVDTPTKATWVAEFIQELTARMRKCEYIVSLRPEPWFPKVPSHIRFGIYVVINQGVIPVDDLDQSGLAEWHALEGRHFATAAAFLAMSSDRPADSPVPQSSAPQSSAADYSAPQSSAPQSSAPQSSAIRTSVGKALCWNDRPIKCFNAPVKAIGHLHVNYLSRWVEFAWVKNGVIVPLARIHCFIGSSYLSITDPSTMSALERTASGHELNAVTLCVTGTMEHALRKQLPYDGFDLYVHDVNPGEMLVNNTEDDIVVCRDHSTGYYYKAEPGRCIEPLNGKVVCSEPVLQFAK